MTSYVVLPTTQWVRTHSLVGQPVLPPTVWGRKKGMRRRHTICFLYFFWGLISIPYPNSTKPFFTIILRNKTIDKPLRNQWVSVLKLAPLAPQWFINGAGKIRQWWKKVFLVFDCIRIDYILRIETQVIAYDPLRKERHREACSQGVWGWKECELHLLLCLWASSKSMHLLSLLGERAQERERERKVPYYSIWSNAFRYVHT